ncbi:MAG: hypothetical protein CVU41_12610 [Chloroflexi bacterium HGW-Chloroflexi-3]|nr:MAG: hypothetical protein CVU41_12610 [Chloroflexi bacterium HGW-Chloroflexi-3]
MKPQVVFISNNLQGMLTSGSDWQVQSMDWHLPGGSNEAIISAPVQDPNSISLRLIRSWLGQAVTIHKPSGEILWRGWIEEIHLDMQRLRFGWGTHKLLSRVIARYPQVSPLLDPLSSWQYTDWVEHAERLGKLGAKESLLSLREMDPNKARHAAVMQLNQEGLDDSQALVLLPEKRAPHLTMRLKGCWHRLDWTLDGEESGLIAHLPGGKSQQSFGLSGSERLAQSFTTGSEAFPLGQIGLRIAMLGDASDDLRVKICADNAGVPGTELDNSLLLNVYLLGGWRWQAWLLNAPLSLNANTRYWLVLERNGALDSSQYYQAETDDGRGYPDGECKRWNGSSWVLLNQDLRFCLLAVTETSELMREVAQRAVQGGVLQGVQVWQESGVWIPRWREIEKTRKEALEDWLGLGCADENPLSALVNPDGVLEVFSLPRLEEISVQLGSDGSLCLSSGVHLPLPLDLLGRRMQLPGTDVDESMMLRGLRWTPEEGLMPVV